MFYPPKMPVLSKHLFFQLSRLLLFCILLLGLSQELFALPIKTSILNPEKQVVGQALVYIDYVELLKQDGTPLPSASFPTNVCSILGSLLTFPLFGKEWGYCPGTHKIILALLFLITHHTGGGRKFSSTNLRIRRI